MRLSSDIALRAENVSKLYRLGTISTGTFSQDLNIWWHRIRGKPNPYAKVGEINKRDQVSSSNYIWALKDVNFEVKKGEILGIIGKNGAGKSTLLKILSRITGPTEGKITINGRIGSLLEVGTGFHPELTGRENIFLNGAILGMAKKEIKAKFDEIVDFSGCVRYIDTPVKRYSSGMTVRLGFAIAAFLEPEILVVDEVLAVGDAEFQKKCLGKMKDVSKNEGRTVLFVSHNMEAVQTLCTQGMLLEQGRVISITSATDAVNQYIKQFLTVQTQQIWEGESRPGTAHLKWRKVMVFSSNNKLPPFYTDDDIQFEFEIEIENLAHKDIAITYHLVDERGILVYVGSSIFHKDFKTEETQIIRFVSFIPGNILHYGSYTIRRLLVVLDKAYLHHELQDIITFEILPSPHLPRFGWMGGKEGVLLLPQVRWEIETLA